MEINADIEIDLSGLQCPMPLLKAKLALNSMNSSQVHQILGFQKDDSAYYYWIKKG
jgi:tRNA 2-thiouridine synthesizing protein A